MNSVAAAKHVFVSHGINLHTLQVLEEAGLLSKTAGLFFYDKDMNRIDRLGNNQVPCLAVAA